VYKIILPQIVPVLINSIRVCLIAAIVYLLAGEAIAANEGLGYRIFLVRRYMAMDVIIPYVFVITIIAFIMDRFLRVVNSYAFPWFVAINGGK
jgi:NitT/TauT family transport system permease protein